MNKPFLEKLKKFSTVTSGSPFWIDSNIPEIRISVNYFHYSPHSFSGRLIDALRYKSNLHEKIAFKKNFNAICDPKFKLEDEDILGGITVETSTTYGLIIIDSDKCNVYQIDVSK